MCWRNTIQTYGCITKILHFIIAIAVIGLIAAGFIAGNIDDKPLKGVIYNTHKVVGVFTLGFALLFTLWSLCSTKPHYPDAMATWERSLARLVHWSLYGLIIIMPMSGWIMSSAAERFPHLFDLALRMPGIPASKALASNAKQIHQTLAWVILAAVILHIIGALKHHFIDRNDILMRMFCPSKKINRLD